MLSRRNIKNSNITFYLDIFGYKESSRHFRTNFFDRSKLILVNSVERLFFNFRNSFLKRKGKTTKNYRTFV